MVNLELYDIDPIIGLEKMDAQQTYDIEVEDLHAFYAKNTENNYTAISHNSAHIALLDISHPDIEEFITAKQGDKNKALTQFNISIKITDAFIDRYKEPDDKIIVEMTDGSKHELDPNEEIELDGVIYKASELKKA